MTQEPTENLLTPSFSDMLTGAVGDARLLPDIRKTCNVLDAAYRMAAETTAVYHPCRLQDCILDVTVIALQASRAAIFLVDDAMQPMPCCGCGHPHALASGVLKSADQAGLVLEKEVLRQIADDNKSTVLQHGQSGYPLLCVALRGKTRLHGVVCIDMNRSAQRHGQRELLVATALGFTAGLALENMMMHRNLLSHQRQEGERETAQAIKEGFLVADWKGEDSRIEVAGALIPAANAGSGFYDIIQIDENTIGLVVGETSGRGTEAALAVAQVLATLRIVAKDAASPAVALARVNAVMFRQCNVGAVCAMVCARLHLDTGELVWANAGHPPPLHIVQEGNAYLEEATGPLLGVEVSACWDNAACTVTPGATLLFYSKGLAEARPPGEAAEPFGMGRLWGTPEYDAPPSLTLKDINTALANYLQGGQPQNDCALIALRYRFCDVTC